MHAQTTEYLQAKYTDMTESQRTGREAIAKICSRYPDEYWAHKDETDELPHDLHSDLAKDGWVGICTPQLHGSSECGTSEAAVVMQTISE